MLPGVRLLVNASFTVEGGGMPGVQKLDFDSPDETRTPDKTRAELVRVASTTVGRLTL
jgi:hypothetical protein